MEEKQINSLKAKSKVDYFKIACICIAVVLAIATLIFAAKGIIGIANVPDEFEFVQTIQMKQSDFDEEAFDEDSTRCEVEYVSSDETLSMTVTYSFEEWQKLDGTETVEGFVYKANDLFVVMQGQSSNEEIKKEARQVLVNENSLTFGIAMACALAAVGFFVMTMWSKYFTTYEKCWFLSILVLASVISILLPEESCNGINGLWIMALYLLDTFLNILCELLISKQSKWNFIVSVFVEITEIAICLVLAYRFATMLSTLLFWLPIDILSFINWHKHPDQKEDDLTKVRKLSGWAEVLIILGIIVWTAGVGYFLTTLDFGTDIFGGNRTLEVIVCYLDACVSAVGICNGLFIFFRIREQWIAWFIDALLEGTINILSGQYVLLVLKLGYLTNTTYGYIKWTKYIRNHKEAQEDKKFF